MVQKKKTKAKGIKCLVCNKALAKNAYKIKCIKCEKWAHQMCTNITIEKLEDKKKSKLIEWECTQCKEESEQEAEMSESSSSEEETTTGSDSDTEKKSNKSFTINDVMNKLKMEEKYEKILKHMENINKENVQLRNEIKLLKKEQAKLKKENNYSNTEINKTKQEKLAKGGLAKEDDNKYKEVILSIGEQCNSKIEVKDIEKIQRIGKDNNKPIIKVAKTKTCLTYYNDNVMLGNRVGLDNNDMVDYLIDGFYNSTLQVQARMQNFTGPEALVSVMNRVTLKDRGHAPPTYSKNLR
ncbi:unnamed protein product [Brassicogethes aeneus]|uniref:Zinc finger PHD-type domain-containing protein n=1 Tax=Brassicogethes aeneus TaxID=1431903 RepID=A0A9P0AY72_BRAAE|nr:unnamed protein product [Brassicogethes aeneus]